MFDPPPDVAQPDAVVPAALDARDLEADSVVDDRQADPVSIRCEQDLAAASDTNPPVTVAIAAPNIGSGEEIAQDVILLERHSRPSNSVQTWTVMPPSTWVRRLRRRHRSRQVLHIKKGCDFDQHLCADIDGFSLHAAVRCAADDRPTQATAPVDCEANCAHHRPVRMSWAKLLKRVFHLDLERRGRKAGV